MPCSGVGAVGGGPWPCSLSGYGSLGRSDISFNYESSKTGCPLVDRGVPLTSPRPQDCDTSVALKVRKSFILLVPVPTHSAATYLPRTRKATICPHLRNTTLPFLRGGKAVTHRPYKSKSRRTLQRIILVYTHMGNGAPPAAAVCKPLISRHARLAHISRSSFANSVSSAVSAAGSIDLQPRQHPLS